MKRKKANFEDISTLLAALMPRVEDATKRQTLSLISLVMSIMFMTTPLVSVAGATPASYTIVKNVTDVAGHGPEGNVTRAGDNITYQINVTNHDEESNLTNVNVTDPLINFTDNVTELGSGQSLIYNVTYTVTQADINSNGSGTGFVNNTAFVYQNMEHPQNGSVQTRIIQDANYTIDKTVILVTDPEGNATLGGNVTGAGDVIRYQVIVTNDGNIDLTNVTVNDTLINLPNPVQSNSTATNINDTILEVGEIWNYTGNYTVTQADLNGDGNGTGFVNGTGVIINNATVDCYQLDPQNDSVQTPIIQNASYNIDKTVIRVTDPEGNATIGGNVTGAGDIIAYQVIVTNNGNIDLNNITVNDTLINLPNPVQSNSNATNSNDTILEVGEIWNYTGNYTVTQADLNGNGTAGNGFINNTAIVYKDRQYPQNDSVQTKIIQNANCTIDKTVIGVTDPEGNAIVGNVTEEGAVISYQVVVTNNGNIDLTNVTVNDTLIDDLTGPVQSNSNATNSNDTILQVGEIWNYTGNYTVTQNDINNNGTSGNGFINNTATVSSNQVGPRSASASFDPKSDSADIPINRHPHYSIFKSSIGTDEDGDCIINEPRDIIQYRIVVQNDGNVDLTGVSVDDPMITLSEPAGDDGDEILNPGETWAYTGDYALTQDDINDGGDIHNTATVSSNELSDESSSADVPIAQDADLSIYKSVIGTDDIGDFIINEPGDVLKYQIAVKNNGEVDLTGVSVDDPMITLSGPTGDSVDPGVLNPGETWVYIGEYAVTQTDIDSEDGIIINTATASCNELPDESSTAMRPIIPIIIFNAVTPPVADFSTSVTSGYAPLLVQFKDLSQNAASRSWDFNNDGIAESSDATPTYTYTTPGTYTAKLTVSNGSLTASKPVTITVLQVTGSDTGNSGSNGGSHSSSGSSGSSSVSSEPASNVEAKEISQAFIASGKYVTFDFPKKVTPVVNLSFDAKKTVGQTTTTVELLKGKSTLVSSLPSDEVYKFFNIWVGSSGIITSKDIENAVVCFKVDKSWLQDKNIDQSSITLNRYSDGKWDSLSASLSGDDDKYLYFTAKTPGFSPFAITGKAKAAVTETQPEPKTVITSANVEPTPVQTENKNTSGKGKTSMPGFEIVSAITGLLAVFLYRRR